MKKLIVMMTIVVAAAMMVRAATETIDGYTWAYRINGDTAEINANSSGGWKSCAISPTPTGHVDIPSVLGGYPVTVVGNGAFYYCINMTSVTIPNSVKSIGYGAFYNCSGLTDMTIPDSVESIDMYAFSGCQFASLTMGSGVTYIRGYAFDNCKGLKRVTIPQYVCSQGLSSVFSSAYKSIENVVVLDGTTSIGGSAFYGCSGLTSVTMPNGVTNIGEYAFCNCSGLTGVTIPNGVKSIGGYAFSGCSGLASVTIPKGVTDISPGTFSGCSGLTSMTIPDGVTSIGKYAFRNCPLLTSVAVPKSVTDIGWGAFCGCIGLKSLTLPFIGKNRETTVAGDCILGFAFLDDSPSSSYYEQEGTSRVRQGGYYANIPTNLTSVVVTDASNIGSYAFNYCPNLTNIVLNAGVTNIASYAMDGCGGLKEITIPSTVEEIGDFAFYHCTRLASVTIPNSVTRIGAYAFCGCSELASVTMPTWTWRCYVYDGAFSDCPKLANSDGFAIVNGALHGYYGRGGRVTIPSNVWRIGTEAFRSCTDLTEIVFCDGLGVIGESAFAGCSGLTSVTFPDSVEYIRSRAFSGCTNLERVVFGSAATNVGDSVFADCGAIGEVTVTQGVMARSLESVFPASVGTISNVTILAGATEIPERAFAGCASVRDIVVPDTVTNIGANAFLNCAALDSVVLPEALLEVGDWAFVNCTSLPTLIFPAGVERIGTGACAGDTNLSSVLMPEQVKDIPSDLFQGCTALASLALPVGTETLGNGVFRGCEKLESMTIPNGVKSIGDNVFRQCTNLVSVTVPGSVETVGANVFTGCDKIETAIIPGVAVAGPLADFFPDAWQKVRRIVVAEGPDVIADGAFQDCKELANVVVPASVLQLGEDAFAGCKSLKEVHYMGNAPNFGASLYTGTPLDLVSFVQKNSRGWAGGISTELPETWPISLVAGTIRADAREVRQEMSDVSVPVVCTVKFDARGGRVSLTSRQVLNGTAVGALPVPVRANYAFQGWFTASGGGSQITKDTKVEANTTYYAHWMFAGPSFIVTFDANGGNGGVEVTVESGAAIGDLPTPTRTGYAFDGWFTAANGGTRITASTSVTADVKYYAHWTVVQFNVTFDANGGSGGSVRKVNYGSVVGALPTVTKDNHAFNGWFTAADGGKAVTAETVVTGDVTFYAHWTKNGGGSSGDPGPVTPDPVDPDPVTPVVSTFTVTFNANGGSVSATSRKVDDGAAVGALPTPTREGYTFDGWFTAANGGTKIGAATKVPGNVTYYAHWAVIAVKYGGVVEDAAFTKAQTKTGALYDATGNLVGTVELKFGKMGKKGVKVSASATIISGGKVKKVGAKAMTLADGELRKTLAFKAPIGDMELALNADGSFTLKNGAYEMVGAVKEGNKPLRQVGIGGALVKSQMKFNVEMDSVPDFGKDGTLLNEALPVDEPVYVAGGTKWSFDKVPSLKYAKDRTTGTYNLIGLDDPTKPNVSGLKLSYTAKTGQFKGTFKLYATTDGAKPKLKKFTVNVIGFVVDGVGYGEATLKKPFAAWSVRVK